MPPLFFDIKDEIITIKIITINSLLLIKYFLNFGILYALKKYEH